MRAKIDEVRAASAEEWDAAWRSCPSATYFQSRDWAETWAAYQPKELRPDARLVRFADGDEVILPFTRQRVLGGLVSRWWGSPMTTYGGWLSRHPLGQAQIESLCGYVRERLGCVTWRMNPYDSRPTEIADGWECEPDDTLALSLGCGYEALWEGCAHGHRRAARKAERNGVTVRATVSHGDWTAYAAAYEDSVRRWGAGGALGAALFEEMERRAGEWSTLWVAELDGRVVGGLLCLYAPHHVACWHSAVLEEALPLSPMPLLFFTAIGDACRRGIEWFDFNPSKGLPGVEEFKRRFGARALECPVLTCERGPGVHVWRLLQQVRGRDSTLTHRAPRAARR